MDTSCKMPMWLYIVWLHIYLILFLRSCKPNQWIQVGFIRQRKFSSQNFLDLWCLNCYISFNTLLHSCNTFSSCLILLHYMEWKHGSLNKNLESSIMLLFLFFVSSFQNNVTCPESSLVFSSNLIQHDKNWHQYTGKPPMYGEVPYIKLKTKKLLPSSMHKNCHLHDFFKLSQKATSASF
jgi:hypothetical protein